MMTLEEAIKHCKDVALSCTNKECALEHFQLLKWLQEYSYMLEKQGKKQQKTPIWKHWKDGIAGNGEGKPIYLTKDGYTYSLNSCLCFECDYIELSELEKLLCEKQGEIDIVSYEIAEKEKREFVGDGFIKCYADFQDFKEGETYWLEYVGNDNYNVRSDNLLGKTYHITPCQLYTIFKKQTWLEKQGEQKTDWSEEDDYNLQCMVAKVISDIQKGTIGRNLELIVWLKSLKDRYTWKPGVEQMHAFEQVYDWYNNNFAPSETLTLLYNDLKKLREE